jgi:hypothetical protein
MHFFSEPFSKSQGRRHCPRFFSFHHNLKSDGSHFLANEFQRSQFLLRNPALSVHFHCTRGVGIRVEPLAAGPPAALSPDHRPLSESRQVLRVFWLFLIMSRSEAFYPGPALACTRSWSCLFMNSTKDGSMLAGVKTLKTKSLFLFLSLAMSLAASPVWAQATFGAEFNFTNNTIRYSKSDGLTVNSPESELARDKMMEQVKKVCGDCKIKILENDYGVSIYHVSYPDGWYFDIATDPAVVEVQTKPSNMKTIQKNQDRIQKHIFDVAQNVGLLPANEVFGDFWAGSHIHVGALSALGKGADAVKLLKNFMVDFSNHSELAMGVFSSDITNAPPLGMLPQQELANFQSIIADVESGKIRSINTFSERVRNEVYDVVVSGRDISPTTKYQAFNVNRIGNRHFDKKAQTFELRAMRGQNSAEDFLILTRLIEARLNFIDARGTPVEINLNIQMTPAQQAENFYNYVTESSLDFAPYEKFLNLQQKSALIEIRHRLVERSCNRVFVD